MKTVKEMIAVMQAYDAGKVIEQCSVTDPDTWAFSPAPLWNWMRYNYRIKPEPEYIPYTRADDILADFTIHGPYVKINNRNGYKMLTSIGDSQCYITGESWAFNTDLSKSTTWQDGHPFGKLKE